MISCQIRDEDERLSCSLLVVVHGYLVYLNFRHFAFPFLMWFYSKLGHSTQVGEHGSPGFDAHKEARNLQILIGGVVGLVRVGVGNAKSRDAQGFVEDVLGQAGSFLWFRRRRHALLS